jgi:lipoprotein-releasing system permease protein
MNFEYFIAKRLIKPSGEKKSGKGSSAVINIAVLSIALGLAVMILAVSIVTGFQNEIRSKVIGFGSHIQITNFDLNNSFETKPVSVNQPFYPHIDTVNGIKHIQVFATKGGIIKTEEEVHGVVLKGISDDFDWEFFEKNMVEGEILKLSDSTKNNSVIISKFIADKMKLSIGDKFRMYFIQEPIRVRMFEVAGIYKSGLDQLDQSLVLADIKHIQKLNNWADDQVSGFDITLNNYHELEKMDDYIYRYIGYDLSSTKITDRFKEIFGWLELLDMNVVIIIIFSVLVAAINMISALLILILEKTNMIGILKALGTTNRGVRRIFLYKAAYLIGKGIILGNIVALAIALIQLKTGFITLPQESYYVSEVPVNINLMQIFVLNAGTFVLCVSMLILPSFLITKISPVKAIRFN